MASIGEMTIKVRNAEAMSRLIEAAVIVKDAADEMPWRTDLQEAADVLTDIPNLFTVSNT